MSTRVEGATVLITVTAHATLSAGPAHLVLLARPPSPEDMEKIAAALSTLDDLGLIITL